MHSRYIWPQLLLPDKTEFRRGQCGRAVSRDNGALQIFTTKWPEQQFVAQAARIRHSKGALRARDSGIGTLDFLRHSL